MLGMLEGRGREQLGWVWGREEDTGLGICLASFATCEEGKEVMPGVWRRVVVPCVTFPEAGKPQPLCHHVGLGDLGLLVAMGLLSTHGDANPKIPGCPKQVRMRPGAVPGVPSWGGLPRPLLCSQPSQPLLLRTSSECSSEGRSEDEESRSRLIERIAHNDTEGYSTVEAPRAQGSPFSLPAHLYPDEVLDDLTISPYASFTSLSEPRPTMLSGWLDKLSPQGYVESQQPLGWESP